MLFDWSKPVASLLSRLQENGYKIFSVNDGELCRIDQNFSDRTARKMAVDIITGVDESAVAVIKNNRIYAIYIVLGNDPDEIVADYTQDEELERIMEEYSDYWCDKKCPMIEEAE
jgi:hypothetical protein